MHTFIPHFYKITWFILFALLLLLLLVVQLRSVVLRKQKKNSMDTGDRMAVLEEMAANLQESQKELLQTNKMQGKLISLIIHDLRSQMRFITMLTGNLYDHHSHLSPEEMRERTYQIKKGAQDMYNFSEDFLLWVNSLKNSFSISVRLFPVRELLEEVNGFFREQTLQKGNSLSVEASEDLYLHSDPQILITIIRNLVDNANKHTDQGKILVRAYEEGLHIIISVADTGKGMSRQQIDAFLYEETIDDIRSGSQLGHKFVFDLAKKIGVVVSIESLEQKGTTVKLRLDGVRK